MTLILQVAATSPFMWRTPTSIRLKKKMLLRSNFISTNYQGCKLIFAAFDKYRVTRQVSDLGWVDSDLACSLILLGQ